MFIIEPVVSRLKVNAAIVGNFIFNNCFWKLAYVCISLVLGKDQYYLSLISLRAPRIKTAFSGSKIKYIC